MSVIPPQIWDLLFWLGVILAVNICCKDLLKWIYKYFFEDRGEK